MSRLWKTAAVIVATCPLPVLAYAFQEPAQPSASAATTSADSDSKETAKSPADPIGRIKEEGLKHSKVMETLEYMTDVIGPRLTNSPGMKRANEWTRDAMKGWGLENAQLEAWGPFGKGWTLRKFSAQVIEPVCIPLIAYPKAWSPGTFGATVGEVVHLDIKTDADFEKYKGKLKGAMVLLGQPPEIDARFKPLAERKSDKELLDLADAAPPAPRVAVGRRGEPAAKKEEAGDASSEMSRRMAEVRARTEALSKRVRFAADEGAAVLIDVSGQGDGGTLFVAQATVPALTEGGDRPARRAWEKDAPKVLPQVSLAKEHFNRIVRMLKAGEKVRLEVDLAVEFHEDDLMAYNTVAEVPGTDLKDEVVMLGGHLDSWHSGTGATDNAAGCAVAMEAARIIKVLDLRPRRTIRVALWSGEEQGLLGSRAYVARHFGRSPGAMFGIPDPTKDAENGPSPEQDDAHEKFSAYFNLDNGTGKIRGAYMQGNEDVRPIFRKWLEPFKEMGAQTLTIANTGGTDHLSFDGIGLPGFQFIQDEIEYNSRTHHSNMDVFDRIQADDMKQAAIIMAAFVYNAANADDRLPRKSGGATPTTPPTRPADAAVKEASPKKAEADGEG